MAKGSRKGQGATENVRVVVRTRPMSASEVDGGCEEVMRIGPDKTSIQVSTPRCAVQWTSGVYR